MKIMIVEDEAIASMYLQYTLGHLGYIVVTTVASGEEAVTAAAEHRPDLVLMDVKLNGKMDGITAAQTITAESGIPSIFVSAYGAEEFKNRYRLTEPFLHISKPILEGDLREAIEQVLGGKTPKTPM